MKSRRVYFATLALAILPAAVGIIVGREVLGAVLLIAGVFPAIVFGASVALWRPWFAQGIMTPEDEPPTASILIFSIIVELAIAAILLLSSPHVATVLLVRLVLLFIQTFNVGKLRQGVQINETPLPPHE